MCKYCDYYVKQEDVGPEFEEFCRFETDMIGGAVKIDTSSFISGKKNSPKLVTSTLINVKGDFMLEGQEARVDIKYCPFCGIELKPAREKFEEEYYNA